MKWSRVPGACPENENRYATKLLFFWTKEDITYIEKNTPRPRDDKNHMDNAVEAATARRALDGPRMDGDQ